MASKYGTVGGSARRNTFRARVLPIRLAFATIAIHDFCIASHSFLIAVTISTAVNNTDWDGTVTLS